jgi:hypothetical protein
MLNSGPANKKASHILPLKSYTSCGRVSEYPRFRSKQSENGGLRTGRCFQCLAQTRKSTPNSRRIECPPPQKVNAEMGSRIYQFCLQRISVWELWKGLGDKGYWAAAGWNSQVAAQALRCSAVCCRSAKALQRKLRIQQPKDGQFVSAHDIHSAFCHGWNGKC